MTIVIVGPPVAVHADVGVRARPAPVELRPLLTLAGGAVDVELDLVARVHGRAVGDADGVARVRPLDGERERLRPGVEGVAVVAHETGGADGGRALPSAV